MDIIVKNLEPKVRLNILQMSRVFHDHSFWDEFLLTLALKIKDMCHGIINPGLIII